MKAVKITDKNADAIVAALAAVNGKATAHAWTYFGEIDYLARVAEKQLLDLIGSQKAAVGAAFRATSGSKVANAYKYTRSGTAVTLERRSTGWFLVHAAEETLYPNTGGDRRLILTQAQDAKAVEVLRSTYTIAPFPAA
jgi:hypothetical protein